MENSDVKRKRSGTEDFLEKGPPAKIQVPQPSLELVEANVDVLPAVITYPQIRITQQSESCGDEIMGGDQAMLVPSLFRQRSAVKKALPLGETLGSFRSPTPSFDRSTSVTGFRPKVTVKCSLATSGAGY